MLPDPESVTDGDTLPHAVSELLVEGVALAHSDGVSVPDAHAVGDKETVLEGELLSLRDPQGDAVAVMHTDGLPDLLLDAEGVVDTDALLQAVPVPVTSGVALKQVVAERDGDRDAVGDELAQAVSEALTLDVRHGDGVTVAHLLALSDALPVSDSVGDGDTLLQALAE